MIIHVLLPMFASSPRMAVFRCAFSQVLNINETILGYSSPALSMSASKEVVLNWQNMLKISS
jgi:hypothetical protein